jgi:hypothetical protein
MCQGGAQGDVDHITIEGPRATSICSLPQHTAIVTVAVVLWVNSVSSKSECPAQTFSNTAPARLMNWGMPATRLQRSRRC